MNASMPIPPQARRTPAVTGRRRRTKSAVAGGKRGFTLVELLTVIAIIAILTAIILPVFSAVKENARRTACISNMQQMYQAIRQYELDNRKYPDFLLGPALQANGNQCATNTYGGTITGIPMTSGTACTMQQAAGQGLLGGQYLDPADNSKLWMYAGGLYPEYIKSLETFHCPNNTEDLGGMDIQNNPATASAIRPIVGTTATDPSSDNTSPSAFQTVSYYKYDSYDANPDISGGTLNRNKWQTRYSRLWTRVRSGIGTDKLPQNPPVSPDTVDTYNSYRNQLNWRAPSGDTYVTMCTYHAPKGKVTVLWLSGSAKVVDVNKLKSYDGSNANNPNLTGTSGNDYDMYKLGPGD